MENNCGIIILAAGASSRLGQAKQSLQYKQTTLLENSIDAALDADAGKVVVVLGANAATVQPAIKDRKLSYVVNEEWQEGMASSIRCGLLHLLEKQPGVLTAIIMACDQPFISIDLLNQLITLQQQTEETIVASKYADTIGIPAIFDKIVFASLLQLKGDSGAKKIMMQHENIATVPFPLGNIDIDTAADYDLLQKM